MKTLKKNLISNVDAIYTLLKTPKSEFTKSAFHRLRVEIKKLNAIFTLTNFCSNDFQRKKTFLPFKEIFDQAGKVRELQIEEEILEKYLFDITLFEYRQSLENKLLVERSSFFDLLGENLENRLKNKIEILIPFLDQINKKKANRFILNRREAIESLVSKVPLMTDELHKLRKLLKTLTYSLDSLGNEKIIGSEELILIELLGNWHDCDVILMRLEKALTGEKLETTEIEEIEKLKSKIFLKSQELLTEIELAIPLSIFYKETNQGNN